MPYDFDSVEKKILDYWKTHKIFEKSLAKNRKSGFFCKTKKFVFFEGPPTANGLPGIHHVLARVYKDIICRFKTMQGFFVLRKAGWDTHGLSVEIEIEKELGFTSKKDIESYGIDKFNKKAKESVWKYKKEWEKMTTRMGYWLDLDNPYITYENEYIESVWAIIKKIWDRGLLVKAHKVVPFCTRCGTPLSSHEVAQGYKKVTERSVYLKFKIKDKENTYILAWTTTPWTLPGNVALAVGIDIDYVLAEKDGNNYILAKELVGKVLESANIVKEFKGKELIGMEYEPLFAVEELKSEASYKIYEADFVATAEGTGVVHTAVMYGEDDYVLGTKLGLPKIHTVDEQGKFKDIVPDFAGQFVKSGKTENLIVEKLKNEGKLFKEENYEHDYPFCWRCDSPLLYYAKDSWFIKMSAVNKELLANNETINWVPDHIKEGQFGQWIKEGKDWAFSRERYWGTPLPIWECGKCNHRDVIGSIKEIEEKGGKLPVDGDGKIDLHRPYIDGVVLKCKCGGEMRKIPDLIDVWFDSGAMPYAQWHWPFENEDMFKDQFPADYIVEGVDQTRGWFYTLLAISTLLGRGAPYKNVVSLSHILDKEGKKMSKSKGNTVSPFDVLAQYGADATRWYLFAINGPGEYKLFDIKDVNAQLIGFLSTLRNCLNFHDLYKSTQIKPKANLLDAWIFSKLNSLVKEATKELEEYNPTMTARLIEKFVTDDFSNWWLRRSRKRPEAIETLKNVLIEISKLCAPFAPFVADDIYLHLEGGKESVHLENWPRAEDKYINKKLEEEMREIRDVITAGLAARKAKQIKVRQPLASVSLKRSESFPADLSGLITEELNVKEVKYDSKQEDLVVFDFEMTDVLKHEGWVREFMRLVQDMRKEAGYKPTQKIFGQWHSESRELTEAVTNWMSQIITDTLFEKFENVPNTGQKFDIEKEVEMSGNKIWLGLRR